MRAAALLLALLLFAVGAEARTRLDIPLAPDAKATVTLGSCFDIVSLPGYAPIDVTINNHSGQPQQWTLEFFSSGYSGAAVNTMESTFALTVENNGTRTAALLVPTMSSQGRTMPLNVRVTGYGIEGSNQQMVGTYSGSGRPRTPYAVISDSLGTVIWSELSKGLEDEGSELAGSTVDPNDLPEDWRGLSCVAGLWLTGDELNHLSAAQRDAIRTWVHAGGWLMLCDVTEAPPDFRFAGFGQVRALPMAPGVDQIEATIKDELPPPERQSNQIPQTKDFTTVTPNVPLLFGFMGLFAVMVGPVNIFVLAGRRRERLFWTTPLISLCASGLLMGFIVGQDGVGGHGIRSAVVCLFPENRNEVVMQEQLSRTGLLLGSAFQMRDPVCLRQMDNPSPAPTAKGRDFRNEGTAFAGEWFASRAAQAQRMMAVTPTRAEITLVNAADVRAKGAAPVIVSNFETTLETLFYTDDQRRLWRGKEIRTGQRQALARVPAISGTIESGVRNIPDDLLEHYFNQPGLFMASADHGADYLATLGSIHWTDQPVTYLGPVTINP